MNPKCKKIRDELAAEGPGALRDDEAARQHLEECDGCFAFLESLSLIEEGLQHMPRLDAPDNVVDDLLILVDRPDRGERLRAFIAGLLRPRTLAWGSVAAAALIVVVAVGLRDRLPRSASEPFIAVKELDIVDDSRLKSAGNLEGGAGVGATRDAGKQAEQQRQLLDNETKGDKNLAFEPPMDDPRTVGGDDYRYNNRPDTEGEELSKDGALSSMDEIEAIVSEEISQSGQREDDLADRDQEERRRSETAPPPPSAKVKTPLRKSAPKPTIPPASGPLLAGVGGTGVPVLIEDSRVDPEYPEAARRIQAETRVILQVVVRADGTVGGVEVLRCDRPDLGFEEAAVEAVEQWRYEPARMDGKPADVLITVTVEFELDEPHDDSRLTIDDAVQSARAFLAERDSLDGVTFKRAPGYWANNYVPGDPQLRLLQARLAGWDRSVLAGYVPTAPRLHDAASRIGQPFDSPDAAALAVYLHADRRGVTDESRMLLQVGLEGTPRRGGRRPAMNLALVLDLRDEISNEVALGLRSLLEAFNRAKEPGDRFRVFAAGKPGALVVGHEDFRHGFLRVTLDRLVSGSPVEGEVPTLALVGAVAAAISSVAKDEDSSAPMGSNAVILISSKPFGEQTRAVADLAHQGAVAGVTLSVVGIGPDVEPDQIDLVTLAGQGNRRLLASPSEADALVDRELSAVSRAIARAVRLRIRLAPGVELIDVLGSERLDEVRVQRVREAEKSIDLRLSRSLGIEADRGEDEEGIQIVIPSFYAGDSHVVLLDVAVPGPGPIADVTVRYKDLVQLKNGVSRASLDLGRDTRPGGPLERNVLKNLLSRRLSETLEQAGRAVRHADNDRAARLLDDFAELLRGLRHEVAGLDHDPEIAHDLTMLDEYRALVASGLTGRPDQRDYLADSLSLAARLKVLPRPLETRS